MKKYLTIISLILLLLPPALYAKNISFLIIDADSFLVNKAMKGLTLPDDIEARFFIHSDITDDPQARDFIDKSEVVIVDVMMPELSEYLIEHTDMSKKKIYAVRDHGTMRC